MFCAPFLSKFYAINLSHLLFFLNGGAPPFRMKRIKIYLIHRELVQSHKIAFASRRTNTMEIIMQCLLYDGNPHDSLHLHIIVSRAYMVGSFS